MAETSNSRQEKEESVLSKRAGGTIMRLGRLGAGMAGSGLRPPGSGRAQGEAMRDYLYDVCVVGGLGHVGLPQRGVPR